jgi:hypothetical protein
MIFKFTTTTPPLYVVGYIERFKSKKHLIRYSSVIIGNWVVNFYNAVVVTRDRRIGSKCFTTVCFVFLTVAQGCQMVHFHTKKIPKSDYLKGLVGENFGA